MKYFLLVAVVAVLLLLGAAFIPVSEGTAVPSQSSNTTSDLSIPAPDPDPVWGIVLDDDLALSFAEAHALTSRFGRLLDNLPEATPIEDNEDLWWWAAEIIPYFQIEGATDIVYYPQDISFLFFGDGPSHNGVAGRSDCHEYAVVSGRYLDPYSTWSQDDYLFVLAHELAHVQQAYLCRTANRELLEQTAQIAAMEVLSALANSRNVDAFRSVVDKWFGWSYTAMRTLARTPEQKAIFDAVRAYYRTGTLRQANADRQDRMFRIGNLTGWRTYFVRPIEILMAAEDGRLTNLALPQRSDAYGQYERSFAVDDTLYLLEHLEEMIESVSSEG